MRIETSSLAQSMIELNKAIEKKELTIEDSKGDHSEQESQSFIPSPLGSSGTYSLSSLKAAVESYAKFLTVAENNLNAIHHPPTIPQAILDRLNGR
jgi:hypothetical protein